VIPIAVYPAEFGRLTHIPLGFDWMSNWDEPDFNCLLLQLSAARWRPKLRGIVGKNAFGLNNITDIFVNPLTAGLNPSAQRCLTRFYCGFCFLNHAFRSTQYDIIMALTSSTAHRQFASYLLLLSSHQS
jgi:hypothetical protein